MNKDCESNMSFLFVRLLFYVWADLIVWSNNKLNIHYFVALHLRFFQISYFYLHKKNGRNFDRGFDV